MMKNVQIKFDESLLHTVDQLAASSHMSRSALVRKAIEGWLQEREIQQFEEEWIEKLKAHAEDIERLETWNQAEQWGEK